MDETTIPKPRPIPTPTSQPFWEALAADRIVIQRCDRCSAWVFYPRVRCPECLSDALTWHEINGDGAIFTYTITAQPTVAMFADEMPQMIAIVELDEGIRLSTTIVDAMPEDLSVGARVIPVFDHGDDGRTLLRFRLVD